MSLGRVANAGIGGAKMCETCVNAGIIAQYDTSKAMGYCNVFFYRRGDALFMYCIDCGALYREQDDELVKVKRFAKKS